MKDRKASILVTSAGRRNYLIRWFHEALQSVSQESTIVVGDTDPHAPVRAEAPLFERLPPITHQEYVPTLLAICERYDVDVAMSLNDYELSEWARTDTLANHRTLFLRLSSSVQQVIEDKLLLEHHLRSFDINYPPTVTAAAYLSNPRALGDASDVVIKARFGSGSSGLAIVPAEQAAQSIAAALPHTHDRTGSPIDSPMLAVKSLIVQPLINGEEYGLDVVNNFRSEYQTILARKKLAMRGGETDRAETVERAPFQETGARLSEALGHRGLIDCDVIVDGDGTRWVIDINPRFGGGYPFNHIAGANVPLAMARWITGRGHGDALDYQIGFRGAKYIAITGI